MSSQKPMTFYSSCVNWPLDDVHTPGGLCDMCDEAKSITRETFLKHANRGDRERLERCLGYAPHNKEAVLTMKRDAHVGYYRSKLHGERVYFFTHSAIEYVFVQQVTP